MKYFFILGNNPTLSLAELYAVFEHAGVLSCPDRSVAYLETAQALNSEVIKKLGGTIKFGLIKNQSKNNAKEVIKQTKGILEPKPGKFKFGISYYGRTKLDTRSIGMTIKTDLKNNGHSARFVTSQEKTLSSVVVEQNKLATKGTEIVLLEEGNKILIGKTLAVQPFKELSFRDYGRPARDDHSGMLPPKLAQIMLNLSHAKPGSTILDPFCGSGTILGEAIMMGYKNLIGSDISPQAVLDSKKNIRWTADKFKIEGFKLQMLQHDAANLTGKIKGNSIDAIITEPYLGPQRGKIDPVKTTEELEKLYGQTLKEFKNILKPEARIAMIWPQFHVDGRIHVISPDIKGYKIINPLPKNLSANKNLNITKRQTIIYGRENQRVWREIIILEK